MARGSKRPAGMTDYEWRIYRQLGITLQEAQARGISRQKARGHGRKTAAPGRGEKAQTSARRVAAGGLSDVDMRFRRTIRIRTSPVYERRRQGSTVQFVVVEAAEDRFERAWDAYLRLSPAQREIVRKAQQALARRYRNGRRGNWMDYVSPSDAAGEVNDEIINLFDDDSFANEWPTFDNDLMPLYFYH